MTGSAAPPLSARCFDCFRLYGDQDGFPDLIIPDEAWRKISPTGDDGGLLCPSCICARLHLAGMRNVYGAFMSGPVRSVEEPVMQALRMAENAWRVATRERVGEDAA